MKQDFFRYLPSEITINILARLPLRSKSISKCVCKPWLNLIESGDFVKSEIKTPPTLVLLVPETGKSTMCTILEFGAEDEEADLESYAPVHLTDIEIPHGDSIPQMNRARQANGLLLLDSPDLRYVYISNPLTRQCIKLCLPDEYASDSDYVMSFGFCMSIISGQYKVICINGCVSDSHHVYTLGTGTWRRVEAGPASGCRFNYEDHYTVCNGNPHWAVCDSAQTLWISVFDLETECFSIFSPPAVEELLVDDKLPSDIKLDVLRDCLSLIYTINEGIPSQGILDYGVPDWY